MSPTCVQNEIVDGGAQVLVLMSQLPPQQSALAVHALPAVWQPVPICVHLLLVQALGPLQHGVPPAVQESPSETHCVPPQTLPVQFKLQQSPAVAQLAPAVLHTDAAH
jgi:hypothetical protein